MRGWVADLEHSARSLIRRPGFTALTVATLAVGIGTATAIFSLAEMLLLRPLPMEESDRLVRMYSANATRGSGWFSVSYPDYRDLTGRSDVFESSTFYNRTDRDIAGDGDPERVETASVYRDFFQVLRSPLVLGRPFLVDDHDRTTEATAVLAESFWGRRFGADSTIVGASIRLDGVPHTVVGVVPDRHAWPPGVHVWTPLQWGASVPESVEDRSNHAWQVVGRLTPDRAVDEASALVRSMAIAIYEEAETVERDRGTEAVIVPLHSSEGGEGAGELFGLLGAAVGMVLLIACMNASGMLLTRAWSRARELSVRSALGAGRARLAALLLGESAVLAGLGGVLGVALGTLGLAKVFSSAPLQIRSLGEISLNPTVVMGGLGITLVAALLSGLIPALQASRVSIAVALRDGSVQAGQGSRATRLRRGLVVAELAFSLALLVGAGLTVRGFQRQIATDPGFDASSLVSFTVRLPASRYSTGAQVDAFYTDAVERLERHPAVLTASSTSTLPLGAGGVALGRALIFDGATPPPEGDEFFANWIEVDENYLETLGASLVEGRSFTGDDRAETPLVAIVNQRLARSMAPEGGIVGRTIRSFYDENLPRTVIGVMEDVQLNGVSRPERSPVVLVPRSQSRRLAMAFLVRTSSDAAATLGLVRQTMTELDPDVALDQLQPLRDAHAADLAGIRMLTTIFGTFGVLALLLAVSGVYGLVSYSVSRRTQEIGVRMAMGATRERVRGRVVRESVALAGIGLTLGLGLAYGLGRVLAHGMSGVATMEASTYAGVVVVLGAAVVVASWIPAVRATRVDPVDALRMD